MSGTFVSLPDKYIQGKELQMTGTQHKGHNAMERGTCEMPTTHCEGSSGNTMHCQHATGACLYKARTDEERSEPSIS